jgi:hypothetical protein
MSSATVTVRIALVGDEDVALPSHRECGAVRGMLGDDVCAEWVATDGPRISDLRGFDGIWLVPGSPYADDAAAYAAVEYFRNVFSVTARPRTPSPTASTPATWSARSPAA